MKSTAYRLAGRLPSPIKRLFVRFAGATFLVGVLGIVLDDEGRVLLFRHTYRPFAPWGVPSGLLKPNESPAQAIEREVREETGHALPQLIAEQRRFLEEHRSRLGSTRRLSPN